MIPILSGNVASALPSGYEVANSCRFNSADSAQLSKSVGSSATTKYTLSLWVKRGLITNGTGNGQRFFTSTGGSGLGDTYFRFNTDDTIEISGHGSSATAGGYVITNRLFRDPTAWYHIVIRYDSTESSANDRFRLYINGVDERTVGGYSTSTMPNSSVADNITASGNTIRIGATASAQYFNGYLTEIHFSEGQSYAPTEFGEYDEDSPTIWKPKKANISYGTSGFHLDFEDSSNMGNDANGGTDFTETNIDSTDQATDTCTNNFCTLNPLAQSPSDSTGAYSQGNCVYTVSDYNPSARGTFGMSAGKWYWEIKQSAVQLRAGICTSGFNTYLDTDNANAFFPTNGGAVHVMNTNTGTSWQRTNNSTSKSVDTFTSAIASTSGSIINFAFDADSGKMWWGVDGVYLNSGDPANGTNPTLTAVNPTTADDYHCFTSINDTSSISASFNFGGCPSFTVSSSNSDGNGYGSFEHTVPSGFFSLCTKNLAEYGG